VTVAPSDADLAAEALGGSEAACRALVARYATPAVNLAARMLNNRAQAEDLAQEAFVRAFARLATYDTRRSFASWFFQIVRNVTIDHLRRTRLDTVSLDQLDAAGHPVGIAEASASPDIQAERAALARALDHGLERIRPEYRAAIVLRYQEELTVSEIAEALGVPDGTVKTYLHRGRKELASILSAGGWGPSSTRAETLHRQNP
jgi:RNA polymerase sigma-70 factor (ECF subfamily)